MGTKQGGVSTDIKRGKGRKKEGWRMNEKMQWLFVGLLGLLLNFFVVQTAYVLTIGQADGAPLSGKGIVLGILILFLPNVAFIQLALATKWQLQDLQLAGFAVVGTMLVILPTFLFNTMSYIFAMLLIAAGLVLFVLTVRAQRRAT